jgi:predicted nuclease with TOPRIM domain
MLWEQGLNIKQDLNIRAGLSELKKGLKELEQTRVQLSEQTFAEQLQAVENLKNRLQDLLKRSPKPD